MNDKKYIIISDNESSSKQIKTIYNQYKLIYHFEIINIQIRDNCHL